MFPHISALQSAGIDPDNLGNPFSMTERREPLGASGELRKLSAVTIALRRLGRLICTAGEAEPYRLSSVGMEN
jgi:hypothetical protein